MGDRFEATCTKRTTLTRDQAYAEVTRRGGRVDLLSCVSGERLVLYEVHLRQVDDDPDGFQSSPLFVLRLLDEGSPGGRESSRVSQRFPKLWDRKMWLREHDCPLLPLPHTSDGVAFIAQEELAVMDEGRRFRSRTFRGLREPFHTLAGWAFALRRTALEARAIVPRRVHVDGTGALGQGITGVASHGGDVFVATRSGLFRMHGDGFERVLTSDGAMSIGVPTAAESAGAAFVAQRGLFLVDDGGARKVATKRIRPSAVTWFDGSIWGWGVTRLFRMESDVVHPLTTRPKLSRLRGLRAGRDALWLFGGSGAARVDPDTGQAIRYGARVGITRVADLMPVDDAALAFTPDGVFRLRSGGEAEPESRLDALLCGHLVVGATRAPRHVVLLLAGGSIMVLPDDDADRARLVVVDVERPAHVPLDISWVRYVDGTYWVRQRGRVLEIAADQLE